MRRLRETNAWKLSVFLGVDWGKASRLDGTTKTL